MSHLFVYGRKLLYIFHQCDITLISLFSIILFFIVFQFIEGNGDFLLFFQLIVFNNIFLINFGKLHKIFLLIVHIL
jgi:hypothetical protein